MPLPTFSNTLGKKNAAHLLRRASFGPTKADIDNFAALTPAQAVDLLFKPTPEPVAPVDSATGKSWVNVTATSANSKDGDLQNFFKYWWVGQITGTGVSAERRVSFLTREKIVFFLHSHFTTIQETVNNSRALYFQNVLFRKFAFDGQDDPAFNFKSLAKKIAIDNAMLILLDGRLNIKGRPNENFAREYFELFTIGKGLPGQVPSSDVPGDYIYFTEQDVQAAARVLSGYDLDETFSNIDPDTKLPRCIIKADQFGNATQHDNTTKIFSNRFGNKEISPDSSLFKTGKPTEESMLDELQQLVDLIFDQEETLKNICRKIYRFYVYHTIDTAIETSIIAAMVETFKAENFRIEPVIRELLCSAHFYNNSSETPADDSYGGLIKSPLDLIAGSLIFFEYQLPDYINSADKFYKTTATLIESLIAQGMNFLNPFDVAGYEAYYQFPVYNRSWISANMLSQRYKFIFDTMTTGMQMDEDVHIDLLAFVKKNFAAVAADPDLLIKEIASYIFPMYEEETELTKLRLNYFKAQFLKLGTGLPQGALAFWQFSWQNAETIEASRDDARGMLQDLINAMLQSPEYQLS